MLSALLHDADKENGVVLLKYRSDEIILLYGLYIGRAQYIHTATRAQLIDSFKYFINESFPSTPSRAICMAYDNKRINRPIDLPYYYAELSGITNRYRFCGGARICKVPRTWHSPMHSKIPTQTYAVAGQ